MRGLWSITIAVFGMAGLGAASPSQAEASLTVSAIFDSDQGRSIDLDASWSPLPALSFGAGVGRGKSGVEVDALKGTSLRASTNLLVGNFDADISLQRWRDSSDLTTRSVNAQVGWLFDSGMGLHALLDDRNLDIQYTRQTVLGQTRQLAVGFAGTGIGGELSFSGARFFSAAHFLDYGYGRNMTRARAALNATDTTRFPRLQLLAASLVTRIVGAPDREMGISIGREFARASLQGGWLQQRDALTGEPTNSVTLVHSYRMSKHLELATTMGLSIGATDSTLAFGGVAFKIK